MQSPMQDVHHNHVILTYDQSAPIRPAIRRKTESHSVAASRKGSKQHVNHTHPSKYLQIFNDTQPNCQRRHWQDRLARSFPNFPTSSTILPFLADSAPASPCNLRQLALQEYGAPPNAFHPMFIQCSSNAHEDRACSSYKSWKRIGSRFAFLV